MTTIRSLRQHKTSPDLFANILQSAQSIEKINEYIAATLISEISSESDIFTFSEIMGDISDCSETLVSFNIGKWQKSHVG